MTSIAVRDRAGITVAVRPQRRPAGAPPVSAEVARARRLLNDAIREVSRQGRAQGARLFGGRTTIGGQRMTTLMLEPPGTVQRIRQGVPAREARRGAQILLAQPGVMDRATLLKKSAAELANLIREGRL